MKNVAESNLCRQLTIPAILFVPYLGLHYNTVVRNTAEEGLGQADLLSIGRVSLCASAGYRNRYCVSAFGQYLPVAIPCKGSAGGSLC